MLGSWAVGCGPGKQLVPTVEAAGRTCRGLALNGQVQERRGPHGGDGWVEQLLQLRRADGCQGFCKLEISHGGSISTSKVRKC